MSYNEGVTKVGIKYLGDCLQTNTTLLKLDIMQLCDGIIPAISYCLSTNHAIQQTSISGAAYISVENEHNIDIGLDILLVTIESNKSLQKVSIRCADVFDNEAIAISSCLYNNIVLQHFELLDCKMVDVKVRKDIRFSWKTASKICRFAHSMHSEKDLQKMLLEFVRYYEHYINKFEDFTTVHRMSKIINAVKVNRTLKTLIIIHCGIGDARAAVISDCITHNTTITQLDLSWNLITSKGAVDLFKTIQFNTTIQKLDVSHNEICSKLCNDGIIAISDCLKDNTTLHDLCVTTPDISDQASQHLASALRENLSLHTLSFHQYHRQLFSFDMIILSAIYYNKTLMKMTLPYPCLSFDFCVVQNEVERINMKRRRQEIDTLNVHFTLSGKLSPQ
ncbi:protein NLRC3-like [Dysidea avara]|uniref:protein NLRC3-like n=1 Tax=Dysidea avara TaxID=196820 RepID=UPI0033340835